MVSPLRLSLWLALVTALRVQAAPITSTRLSLSLAPNTVGSSVTPEFVGMNAGHRPAGDTTWLAFAQLSGVNSMRLFGGNGLGKLKGKGPASVIQTANAFAGCALGSCFGANPMYILADSGSIANPLLGGEVQYGPPPNSSEALAGPWWGQSMLRQPVTDVDKYLAAVALLRTPAGHDVANAASFPYPPPWAFVEYANREGALSNNLASDPAAALDAIIAGLGFRPLVVPHTSCGALTFSTLTPADAVYWMEHWEVYKWAYASAAWLWARGVTVLELANEPDLKRQNACLDPSNAAVIAAAASLSVTPAQYVDMYWADWLAVRSVATQDAYEDANADVAAQRRPCPIQGACPLKLLHMASGFSGGHVVTTPGILVGATVNNAYFRFPCEPSKCTASPNWDPRGRTSAVFPWGTAKDGYTTFQQYSYHAYAKTGASLFAQGSENMHSSINSGGALHWRGVGGGPSSQPAVLPVAITEFAQLTEADFAKEGDSSDTYYMASRTGGQLVAFALLGQDIWHFKMSLMPMGVHAEKELGAGADNVNKHGIHFAENAVAPFQVGDQTTSGAVLALIAPYISGRRPLLSCTVSDDSTANVSLGCAVVQDGGVAHIFLANDCANSARSGVGASSACGDRLLTVPLVSLAPHSSSVVVVTEVSSPAETCMNTSSGLSGVTSYGTRPCDDAAFGGAFRPFSETTSRSGYFGEVSQLIPLTALPLGLTYLLPAFGVARISMPLGPQTEAVLPAYADATLFAGANAGASFGHLPVLSVGTSNTARHDDTAVALLLFPLSTTAPTLAVLELTVASAPAKQNTILLLIATAGRAWSEETASWESADWLLTKPTGVISRIAHNFVRLGPAAGGGPGNEAVGHVSLAPGEEGLLKRVDVTACVRRAVAAKAESITFTLVRRFRKNLLNPASAFGDVIPADDLGEWDDVVTGAVDFHSSDAKATELRPRLRLFRAKE